MAGVVQVQCSDLCSTSGDRLVSLIHILLGIAISLCNQLMMAVAGWLLDNQ